MIGRVWIWLNQLVISSWISQLGMSLFLFPLSLSSLIELKKVCQRKVNLIHFLLSISQRIVIVRASVQSDFNLFDTYLIEKKSNAMACHPFNRRNGQLSIWLERVWRECDRKREDNYKYVSLSFSCYLEKRRWPGAYHSVIAMIRVTVTPRMEAPTASKKKNRATLWPWALFTRFFLLLFIVARRRREKWIELKLVKIVRIDGSAHCPCHLSSQTRAVLRHALKQYSHCHWTQCLYH